MSVKRIPLDRAPFEMSARSPWDHEEGHYRLSHDRLRRMRLRRQSEQRTWWLDDDVDGFDDLSEEDDHVRDAATPAG